MRGAWLVFFLGIVSSITCANIPKSETYRRYFIPLERNEFGIRTAQLFEVHGTTPQLNVQVRVPEDLGRETDRILLLGANGARIATLHTHAVRLGYHEMIQGQRHYLYQWSLRLSANQAQDVFSQVLIPKWDETWGAPVEIYHSFRERLFPNQPTFRGPVLVSRTENPLPLWNKARAPEGRALDIQSVQVSALPDGRLSLKVGIGIPHRPWEVANFDDARFLQTFFDDPAQLRAIDPFNPTGEGVNVARADYIRRMPEAEGTYPYSLFEILYTLKQAPENRTLYFYAVGTGTEGPRYSNEGDPHNYFKVLLPECSLRLAAVLEGTSKEP